MIKVTQDSRWAVRKDNKIFKFQVIGIWYKGSYETTRAVSYELKYEHIEEVQLIEAEKLESLINNKNVIPFN